VPHGEYEAAIKSSASVIEADAEIGSAPTEAATVSASSVIEAWP
jgi:hypothetical protein